MRRFLALGLLVAGFGLSNGIASAADGAGQGVRVVADEAHQRVDITIDGKAFTSYIWPTSLKKPVLYPLITDEGITVTRGYPLEPRPGERVDHPHHAGMWFNYGNVNGFDFWNNSDAIKPEGRSKMGTIITISSSRATFCILSIVGPGIGSARSKRSCFCDLQK